MKPLFMSLTRKEKGEILEKLKKVVKEASSLVFVGFKGLTVADATNIRRTLKKSDVGFVVTKKTLAKIAIQEEKYEGELPDIKAEMAMVYSKDELASSREIFPFVKKLEGRISILGGVFGNKFQTVKEIEGLALIPSLEVLRGQLAFLLNSPMQRLVIAFSEVSKNKQV